jgi:hypothetical protein
MRNKKISARIQAALERDHVRNNGIATRIQNSVQRLNDARSIVDRRLEGERHWKLKEIAARENVGYMTVHRALKGRPGWFAYGRTTRATDTLYRAWLTAIALGMPLDAFLNLPDAA